MVVEEFKNFKIPQCVCYVCWKTSMKLVELQRQLLNVGEIINGGGHLTGKEICPRSRIESHLTNGYVTFAFSTCLIRSISW